jgi:ClpP class serine protease
VTEAIIEEQVEQFLSTVHRRAKLPPDPDDAAEEEAWLAADQAIEDGDAVELDPMQDPFEAEREDVEREDEMFDPFSTTSDGERRVGA